MWPRRDECSQQRTDFDMRNSVSKHGFQTVNANRFLCSFDLIELNGEGRACVRAGQKRYERRPKNAREHEERQHRSVHYRAVWRGCHRLARPVGRICNESSDKNLWLVSGFCFTIAAIFGLVCKVATGRRRRSPAFAPYRRARSPRSASTSGRACGRSRSPCRSRSAVHRYGAQPFMTQGCPIGRS